MSTCFAIGQPKRPRDTKTTSGIRAIEYLKYNLFGRKDDSIDLTGDFFLPNPRDTRQAYLVLHPGDVTLLASQERSPRGDFFTSFLRDLYAPSTGCQLDRSGRLVGLYPEEYLMIDDVRGPMEYWSSLRRVDTRRNSWAPFSLFEVSVPPRTLGFIRLHGTIGGQTFQNLTDGQKCFDIYGGDVLLDRISSKYLPIWLGSDHRGSPDYAQVLAEFTEASYVVPERYDMVLASTPGGKTIRSRKRTRDLVSGYQDIELQEHRIHWYWSDSALFYVEGYPNGPHVDVVPVEESTASVRG